MTPDGKKVSEECTQDDVKAWLDCALGGCKDSPELEKFALAGIQEKNAFWRSVILAGMFNSSYWDQVLLVIAQHGGAAGQLNKIPDIGWHVLGIRYGNVAANFMRTSLSDLLNGTNLISTLPASDLFGATPWWFWNISPLTGGFLNGGDEVLFGRIWGTDNSIREWESLQNLTLDLALSLTPGSANDEPWSFWQRQLLAGEHLGVSPTSPPWDPLPAVVQRILFETLVGGW